MDSKKVVKKPTSKKAVKKPTLKKATPKKVAKPTVITLKNNKDDFNLENKAIYFAKLDTCYFCNAMKDEWEKAKQNNLNIKIYEIDGNYLNKYPDIQSYVPAFPTILRYNNDQFKVFNRLRTAQNFSNFMRNG